MAAALGLSGVGWGHLQCGCLCSHHTPRRRWCFLGEIAASLIWCVSLSRCWLAFPCGDPLKSAFRTLASRPVPFPHCPSLGQGPPWARGSVGCGWGWGRGGAVGGARAVGRGRSGAESSPG